MIILHIEDNEGDAILTKEAFDATEFSPEIIHVWDGKEALDFLEKGSKPDLILLDLNMPNMDGKEVLKKIKSNDKLKSLPVIVLTTSSNPVDVDFCFANGCNAYVQKDPKFSGFMQTIQKLSNFWIGVNTYPSD